MNSHQYPQFNEEILYCDSAFGSTINKSTNECRSTIEFLKNYKRKLLHDLTNLAPSQSRFVRQKQVCEFVHYEIETLLLLEVLSGRWKCTQKNSTMNISNDSNSRLNYAMTGGWNLDTKLSHIINSWMNSSLSSQDASKSFVFATDSPEMRNIFEKIDTLKKTVFWLEECSHSSDIVDESVPLFGKWDHTLHDIKNVEKVNKFAFDGITEMDPDAVNRQKRTLNRRDFVNDEVILKQLWRYFRSGNIDLILNHVKNGKQTWRGASLRFPLTELGQHLHSFNQKELIELKDLESLFLYLFCVQKMLCNPSLRMSATEQSIFGALSGHSSSAYSGCEHYEDYLWVNTTTSLLSSIMILLLQYYKHADKSNIIQFKNQSSLGSIIESLWSQFYKESQKSLTEVLNIPQKSLQESTPYFYDIQKRLIKKEYDQLFNTLDVILNDDGGYMNVSYAIYSNFLRFASSLTIFLLNDEEASRNIKSHPQFSRMQIIMQDIIMKYIHHLRSTEQYDHIAFYSSYLSNNIKESLYSKLLTHVENDDSRRKIYKQAKESRLNLDNITSTIIHATSSDARPLDTYFENKIKLISFLQHDTDRILDLLKYVNELVREVIRNQKFHYLQEIMKVISQQDFEQKFSQAFEGDTLFQIEEYQSWRQLSTGLQLYEEWNSHHLKRPHATMPAPVVDKTLSGALALQRISEFNKKKLEQWQVDNEEYMHCAMEQLKEIPFVLLGISRHTTSSYPNGLAEEFKIAIPHVIFLMLDIYARCECYGKCLLLSHYVASDQNGLYHAFSTNDLNRFLNLMSSAQQNLYQQEM